MQENGNQSIAMDTKTTQEEEVSKFQHFKHLKKFSRQL